jgi:Zn-dependent protease
MHCGSGKLNKVDGMNENDGLQRAFEPDYQPGRGFVAAEVVPEPPRPLAPQWRHRERTLWLPLLLFAATCLSTWFAGGWQAGLNEGWKYGWIEGLRSGIVEGLKYAVPLMTILLCHEMGHFLQARRYGVYASYPYFIPMPISPIGTFGAVIGMEPGMGSRRALFDIGISGPLAGLVPTFICCLLGLHWSHVVQTHPQPGVPTMGSSILFDQLVQVVLQPPSTGSEYTVILHPMAFAGWVGLLITSINLIPIGQLDGGHILYALLRRKARPVATVLMMAAVVAVIWYQLWMWTVMLFFLALIGPVHPPTANDDEPLGAFRIILGWLTLAFIPFGFTPEPFIIGR